MTRRLLRDVRKREVFIARLRLDRRPAPLRQSAHAHRANLPARRREGQNTADTDRGGGAVDRAAVEPQMPACGDRLRGRAGPRDADVPQEAIEPHRRAPFSHHACRSEEHTSELQSLMRISYAVFCLKTKTITHNTE